MAATTDQTHFRFGVDELAESTHGWRAAQDTNISIAPATTFLLRFMIQETGGISNIAPVFINVYSSKNGAAYDIVDASDPVIRPVTCDSVVEDADCTNRLTGGVGAFTVNNDGQSEAAAAGGAGVTLLAGTFLEAEFSFQVQAAGVAHGDTIDFKLYINGAPLTAYTAVPRLTVNLSTEAAFDTLDSKVSGRADGPWFTSSR